MARRRVKPQRGWVMEGGNATLTWNSSGPVWANDVLVSFADMSESTSTQVEREKSTWYFERIIFWFTMSYRPTSVGNPQAVPVHVKLGVAADDVTLQTGIAQAAIDFDFNEWTRVLQEDTIMCPTTAALVRDGGALSVSTAAVADELIYPVPLKVHRWDLRTRFGLQEDSSFLCAFGPWSGGAHVPATGDEFEIDWKLKALARKRKA